MSQSPDPDQDWRAPTPEGPPGGSVRHGATDAEPAPRGDDQSAPPAPEPYGSPSNGYGQPSSTHEPSSGPYGQGPAPYGQAPAPYGQVPSPYGQGPEQGQAGLHGPAGPYAPVGATRSPTWTVVLLVLSGALTLTGVGILWAGPATLAIIALTKNTVDPAGARRLTRIGWWVAAGLGALTIALVVLVVVLVAVFGTGSTTSGYDSSTVSAALTALSIAAGR